MRRVIRLLFALLLPVATAGCKDAPGRAAPDRLVFKLQPLGGDPRVFEGLIDAFRRDNPEVTVVTELLPNSSDVTHQYFLTALEGGATDFDVLVADVVWVPELARAGWIADLSTEFPPDELRRDFWPGIAQAVIYDGKTFAVPWYADAGLLYFRTDLVPRAPKTYAELLQVARDARSKDPSLRGYVWQGRQYEGLVCVVFEAIWGHGGRTQDGERLLVQTPESAAALEYLRAQIKEGIAPHSVLSMAEEEARRTFQDGRAVFMRNWPYAYGEAQKEGSPIRGKVDFAPLPTIDGTPGAGTLGGWQLAVNAHSSPSKRRIAARLIAHLTSAESNLKMALAYGRNPPRRALYDDPRLLEAAPFIARLKPIVEHARPRPVTPYYSLLSDVLQSEFSAAVADVRPVDESLARIQRRVDQITGAAR